MSNAPRVTPQAQAEARDIEARLTPAALAALEKEVSATYRLEGLAEKTRGQLAALARVVEEEHPQVKSPYGKLTRMQQVPVENPKRMAA